MLRRFAFVVAGALHCSTSQPIREQPCTTSTSLAAACSADGGCPANWSTASDAAAWCGSPPELGGSYMGVSVSTNTCDGVRAVFAWCCKDVGWTYYFDVDSGALVGVSSWAGAPTMSSCAGVTPADCRSSTSASCCSWQQAPLVLSCDGGSD